jgi:hypothetical protein
MTDAISPEFRLEPEGPGRHSFLALRPELAAMLEGSSPRLPPCDDDN